MKPRNLVLSLLLSFSTVSSLAGTSNEISHLLGFISDSNCTFIRNGEHHDAKEARKHIEGKYDYARTTIGSAEQFISYAATKSSLSGQAYRVYRADPPEK